MMFTYRPYAVTSIFISPGGACGSKEQCYLSPRITISVPTLHELPRPLSAREKKKAVASPKESDSQAIQTSRLIATSGVAARMTWIGRAEHCLLLIQANANF